MFFFVFLKYAPMARLCAWLCWFFFVDCFSRTLASTYHQPSFTFDFQLNMFFLITSLVHVLDFVPAYSLSLLLNYHQYFIFIICLVIKFLD